MSRNTTFAAVQRREGQQVEDAHVHGDERQQLQQVLPAVAGGLPDGRYDAHRAGEVVDALPPPQQVAEREAKMMRP